MKKAFFILLLILTITHIIGRIYIYAISPSPMYIYSLIFPTTDTEFATKEFTHQKFLNLDIGTSKLETDSILGKTKICDYTPSISKNYVDGGEFMLVDTAYFHTIYGRDNHKTLEWRQYSLFYDKKQKLIGKHYRWFYE